MIKKKNVSLGVLCSCGKKTPITEEAQYNIIYLFKTIDKTLNKL